MTPSDEMRPLKCDCLQYSGYLYTPHSPKCSADNIAALLADRDRLAERVKIAEADNATLVKAVDAIRRKSYEPDPELPALSTRNEIQLMAEAVLTIDHPSTALAQRLAGMEDTLRFYANPKNYENNTVDIGVGSMEEPNSNEVFIDNGRKAQQALEVKNG